MGDVMATSTAKRKPTAPTRQSNVGRAAGKRLQVWQQALALLGQGALVDRALGGTGCVAAVVSAGFAIYMAAHPRPMFNGVEHLMLFAQPNYRDEPVVASANPPADRKGIDYSATGSIRAPGADMAPLMSPAEPIVRAYSLHYVHQGEALIVGKDEAVYRVVLGSEVPGVGRVLAIEERHGQWVVVTPKGVIVAR